MGGLSFTHLNVFLTSVTSKSCVRNFFSGRSHFQWRNLSADVFFRGSPRHSWEFGKPVRAKKQRNLPTFPIL